jgi:glycosyltransferase involved in cell wall biosynthesis
MQVAGAEVLVSETIRRLAGRIEPSVFCLDAVGVLGERLRAQGVEVLSFGRRPGRDWRMAWRMAREIRARGIEILHAHQYTPFFYAALGRALSQRQARIILTEHGRHYPDVVSPLRRAANRLVLDRLADAVNACCAFSARSLGRLDGFAAGRIEVIPNGIEVGRYGPAVDRASLRERLGLDPGRRYVVNVARFHPVKDQAMLLRAFGAVAAARPGVDLLLVGDGLLRPDLERLVRELEIADRVRFLGVRFDVPDLLRAADVFALTSVSEAASLTLLEAMASGLPVVVTDVGGNPEIVRDGVDGLLVPRGDDRAAAAAFLRLLDDPAAAARMGAAGRARTHERYRIEQTIDSYLRLYLRLCGRTPAAEGACHGA